MCIGWYSEIEQIADLDVATALVVERPPTTGDPRFDALLAGLVEDLAARGLVRPPEWIYDPDRFLDVFWFPVDLPSLRIAGLRDAPAALARRCVFLDRRDLQRV